MMKSKKSKVFAVLATDIAALAAPGTTGKYPGKYRRRSKHRKYSGFFRFHKNPLHSCDMFFI